MITLPFNESRVVGFDIYSRNGYVDLLSEWEAWLGHRGLTRLPAGSQRTTSEPGHWFIQTYRPNQPTLRTRAFSHGMRQICFDPADRRVAMMFKLSWL